MTEKGKNGYSCPWLGGYKNIMIPSSTILNFKEPRLASDVLLSSKIICMPSAQIVLAKLDQIEKEMRRLQLWQATPLPAEQYDFRAAFAGDTMSFPQWLQFIFIPNVRRAAASENFPSHSQVGARAVREFDGMDEASGLIDLLSEFDSFFR